MVNLKDIIENSGDSIIEEYVYAHGVLSIDLYRDDLNKKIKIFIRTDHVTFNNYYLAKREKLFRTCRIEIEDLRKVLSTNNGIYVPPAIFGKLMNESSLTIIWL